MIEEAPMTATIVTKVHSNMIRAVAGLCLLLLALAVMPKNAMGGPTTTPSKRGASVEMISVKRAPISWLHFVGVAALRVVIRLY